MADKAFDYSKASGSIFEKYGTGGRIPGDYAKYVPGDDNSGVFTYTDAANGTENNQPDSFPEVTAESFGSPEHNPAGALEKA